MVDEEEQLPPHPTETRRQLRAQLDAMAAERDRVRREVLAFCHNKMHRLWHRELEALFRASSSEPQKER